jgi:thioredoxin-dependent adenylylsulfate APS reductase
MDIEAIDAPDLLRWAWEETKGSFAIVTSFQAEGMVLLDMASRVCPDIRAVTVDTGRLPEETHQMIEQVRERYGITVEVATPDPFEVESMVEQHGTNLFYKDSSLRMLCCEVRKVRPLERKLSKFRAWATGIRQQQNDTRKIVKSVSVVDGRLKVCPLAEWTSEDVAEYIARYDVPQHPLYAQGFPSIGCEPCTRATKPGEDERAGRWWWEQGMQKECGIHFSANGSLKRNVDILLDDLLKTRAA